MLPPIIAGRKEDGLTGLTKYTQNLVLNKDIYMDL